MKVERVSGKTSVIGAWRLDVPLDPTLTPQHHSSITLPRARTSHLWAYQPAVMSVMKRLVHHHSQLWRLCIPLLEDDPQTIPRSWGFTFRVYEGIGEWSGKKVYRSCFSPRIFRVSNRFVSSLASKGVLSLFTPYYLAFAFSSCV